MSNRYKALQLVFVAAALLASTAAFGQEETQWQKDHPRRNEVNQRLNNQNQRIDQGEKSGQLSPGQARQLHREDHKMRKEERNMAAKDGGHITRRDQAKLNRQENRTSKQIHNERHGKK